MITTRTYLKSLIIPVFLMLCQHLAATNNVSQGFQFKLTYPTQWISGFKYKGTQGYTYLENENFLVVEATQHSLGGAFIAGTIDNLQDPCAQSGFAYRLKSNYQAVFDNIEIINMDIIPVGSHRALRIQWMGTAREAYFEENTEGQLMHFSNYYIPSPYHWQQCYEIVGFSSLWNENIENEILDVVQTFQAEYTPPSKPQDWRFKSE